jgi:23S rRNA (adenine2503-C2)-methyltransferase
MDHGQDHLPRLPALLGMDRSELAALAVSLGQPAFRGGQLESWLYKKCATSIEEMSDLPKPFRERLAAAWRIGREAPMRVDVSRDGTRKYLFREGGGRFIEAAFIPEEDRATLCVSTQAGCKMGCLFCATGRQGFQGQLDAGQILNQYLSIPEREAVTNIVYMGMGEPLDNLASVLRSLEILTSHGAVGMSPRKITVSTVGILPALKEFLERSEAHLAVSIHSPYAEERRDLMPVQAAQPMAEVLAVLRAHDWSGQRRLSFEYIMFAGLNDDETHARELVRILNGLRCRVNLIHWHTVPGAPPEGSLDLRGCTREAMEAFQEILKAKGLVTTIRKSRGLDIQAACGLLSTKELVRRAGGA